MPTLLQRARKNPVKFLLLLLTGPIIYGLLIPFIIADLCGTFYQWTCFPIYGIPKVRRRDYIVMDRGKLAYLDFMDKINCIYCEYANGVIAYVGEITARTEWFWCPIKHGQDMKHPHEHYGSFVEYGDADYRGKLKDIRKKCRACETSCTTK